MVDERPADEWADHAGIWDADEDARLFSREAFASLLVHADVRRERWRKSRVLDVGCGTGLLTEKLAPWVGHITAIDASPAMLEVLRGKRLSNVEAICADIDKDAVQAATWFADFDLIVASSLCSFLPHYPTTLTSLAGALSPNGLWVQWDWWLDRASDDEDGLTADAVGHAFERAALDTQTIARAFSVGDDADREPVLIGVGRKR